MDRDRAMEILQQATALHASGQLEEAAGLCEKLIATYPQAADVLQLLGLIRKQQANFPDAERLLRASADLAPTRPDFQANLGNLLAQSGKLAEAEFVYRAALRLDPQFRPARLALAKLYNQHGLFSQAEAEARELLERNRRDAAACLVLGAAQRGQNKLADAEAAFRLATELNPDYGLAHHNLGAVLADEYRPGDALVHYELAGRLGVRGPEIETNRARALIAQERLDDAEALLENAVRQYPVAADPHTLLAKLRHMAGKADFARDLRLAVAQHPENIEMPLSLARLLRGAGNPESAVELMATAVEKTGRHPALLAELARAYQDAHDFAAALNAAREASQLVPGPSRLDDGVIDALMSLGRADEALPLIRRARGREPDDQWHIACEAVAARVLGDPLYESLYDFERLVYDVELPVPPGWSSLAEFNRDLADILSRRNRFSVAPLDQSLRNGTQTPVSLLADEDSVVRAYRQAILGPIADYRARIGTSASHPLTARNRGETILQGAWSVRLARRGYHVNHVHPEGWVSSAYYVCVPDEVSDPDHRNGWIKFGEPRYPVPGVTPERFVQPEAGLLVLFPSYMWHGTTPLRGDAPRVTAPFDVVTAGPDSAR